MIFIFCTSYLSVPATINAIETCEGDFCVISSTPQITELFTKLYSIEKVCLLPSLFTSFRNPIRLLLDFIWFMNHKKKYLDRLKALEPKRILFFFIGYNGFESWLINRLAKNSEVYYRPGCNRNLYKRCKALRLRIKSKIVSLAYNIPFEALQSDHRGFIGMSECFLQMVNAKSYPETDDDRAIVDFFNKRYPELPEFKILLLVGGFYNVEDSEHFSKLNQVCETLSLICEPQQIAIKQHPVHRLEGFIPPEGCVVLPDFLPANLLFYKSSVLIAYSSGALYEAANVGKIAIALLYIIQSTNPYQANTLKQMLLANTTADNQVYFPENFDELKNMCEGAWD